MRRDKADYSLLLEAPTTVSPWRLFAHDEWRATAQTVVNIGTMLENDGFGNTSQAPRVSVNYHLTPQQTVRLGWSTATRSPAMSEALIKADNTVLGGMYVQPLVPLQPEHIETREIGYLGEFRSIALTLDVRLYQERVRDQIWYDKWVIVTPDIDFSPDSFKNLFSAEFKGLEVTLKHQWDEGRSFVVGNYAYQEASAGLSGMPTQYDSTVSGYKGPSDLTGFPTWGALLHQFYQQEYFNSYPEFTPKHSLSLLLSQDLGSGWRLGGGYYYRGQVRVGDVSSDVTPETAMHRLDLNLSKSFKLDKGTRAEATLVVQNASQDAYTKYGTVNAAAEMPFVRRAWLGVNFSF
jgi:iron complex outermembrane receptor protein